MFVVFDGVDGCGKTTIVKLLCKHLKNKGVKVWTTKEPTSSKIGSFVKKIVNEREDFSENWGRVLALLFTADRYFHQEEIKSKLEEGYIVISDRYYYSSFAYQSLYPNVDIRWIIELNKYLIKPNIAFIIDVDPEEALRRILNRSSKNLNIYEKLETIRKVRENFLKLKNYVNDKLIYLDGMKTPEEILKDVLNILKIV